MDPVQEIRPAPQPAAIQAIHKEVQKEQRADLIEASNSPYLAPMVVVPKPDEAFCVCINFRQVNLDIVDNAYHMHQIEDQINVMGRAKVFTALDLIKAYHQLLLHPNLKPLTSFSWPDGLFQLKVLPLGMKTAGAVLQRVMDQIL